MTRRSLQSASRELVGEAEVRRLLSRCWGGASVTTAAVAVLARLEDDPLPVMGMRDEQLVVDVEAVTGWAERVAEDRPWIVADAQRAMRGDWHLALRAVGRDAVPAAARPAVAEAEAVGGSKPCPSPRRTGADAVPGVEEGGGLDVGSRWIRGWERLHRFVNRFEPMELEALRKWARHPLRPLPVVWTGGRLVGGKMLGAKMHAERAAVEAWLQQRRRVALRRAAA